MIKVLDILADYGICGMAFERITEVRGRDRQISIDRFTNKDSRQRCFYCVHELAVLESIMAADRVIIFDSDQSTEVFRQWHGRTE